MGSFVVITFQDIVGLTLLGLVVVFFLGLYIVYRAEKLWAWFKRQIGGG